MELEHDGLAEHCEGLASLQRDALRYRAIRNELPCGVIFDTEFDGPEQLDAAIDAALATPSEPS